MDNRGGFKSKFGLIAAVGGSVVGLGNIWRFPYLAGENGGAAFIFVYIVICFLITVPLMISEFVIGRSAKTDVVNAFRRLTGGRRWEIVGYVAIISSFVMVSFYSVIGGWSLDFIKEAVLGNFTGKSSSEINIWFDSFVNSGTMPVIWSVSFIVLSCIIVIGGIEKGIEKFSKMMMPLIIFILFGLFIYSISMKGFGDAISFLFKPDFSKITPKVVLLALGQSFFSLSIGMGTMITYGSYIKDKVNLGKLSSTIAITDTSVAILSGLAIFPAVFTMGISPTSGPDLVFITLPSIFAQMPFGYFVSIIFFILLFVAAVTSSISLIEVLVTYLRDEFELKRSSAVIITCCTVSVVSSFITLSLVQDSAFTIGGMSLFDIADKATGVFLLPFGGMLAALFIGWYYGRDKFADHITNNYTVKLKESIINILYFIIKFVAPIVIGLLFISLL